MSKLVRTTTRTRFKNDVMGATNPILIDFYADWCAPCRQLQPIIEQLAEDFQGRLEVMKVDVDQHLFLAREQDIQSIPSMLLFKDGVRVETIVGMVSKKELTEIINDYL